MSKGGSAKRDGVILKMMLAGQSVMPLTITSVVARSCRAGAVAFLMAFRLVQPRGLGAALKGLAF